MAIKTVYECDLSDMVTEDRDDVVIFQVTRGTETTTTVVAEVLVTEEVTDNDEGLLAQILFRE